MLDDYNSCDDHYVRWL